MGWDTIAELIVKYGIPLAESLVTKWFSKAEVTPEAWAELKGLASQNANTIMLAQLKAAGIDPASDQGKKLLELAS